MYKTLIEGSLPYGKPTWLVTVADHELPRLIKHYLVIGKETWDHVARCRETGRVVSCTQEHEHILMVSLMPSERAKLIIAPTNASELTRVANYLGDRLPEDFYKYYANILVKC